MTGLFRSIPGILATARASSGVSEGIGALEPPGRGGPLVGGPGEMVITLVPRLLMLLVTLELTPWVSSIAVTTADTPMKMPRVVSRERRRFAQRASIASPILVPSFPARLKRWGL